MPAVHISGRKEVIAEFKALVASFPEEVGTMQGQLRKLKEIASDVHSLQALVQSFCSILDRKVGVFDIYHLVLGCMCMEPIFFIFIFFFWETGERD